MLTSDELWLAQLEFYPNSVRLTASDMIEWADSPRSVEQRLQRFRAIAMALQNPVHVWYRTRPERGYIGCRYGVNGGDYISNFNDYIDGHEVMANGAWVT